MKLKNTNNFIGKIGKCISSAVSSLSSHYKTKFRIHGRIRLLNRWGRKNPKRLMASFLGIMIFILFLDTAFTFFSNKKSKDLLPDMIMVDNVFDGMRKIEYNREVIRQQYNLLIDDGKFLLNELDSLNNKKVKTHQDSIRIGELVAKLNVINNILKDEEN